MYGVFDVVVFGKTFYSVSFSSSAIIGFANMPFEESLGLIVDAEWTTRKNKCSKKLTGAVRLELTARGFGDHCSTN